MTRPLDPGTIKLDGIQLIEASAGTGKTYTITQLYIRLLVEEKLDIENILVVTFTEAATAELRDRIRMKLREARTAFEKKEGDEFYTALFERVDAKKARERIDLALESFDLAAIHTIHGFCGRILTENAFESGAPFDSEIASDIDPLIEEVVNDFWVARVYDEERSIVQYLREEKISPRTLISLAKKIRSRSEADILPGRTESPEMPTPETGEKAYREGRKLWREAGEKIKELLLEDDTGLNRNKYRKTSLEKWFEELDGFFEDKAQSSINLPEHFFKFTPAGLDDGLKAKSSPPSHPFFEACERLEKENKILCKALEARALELKLDLADEIRTELPRRMKERCLMGFDDILRNLDSALRGSRGEGLAKTICSLYKAALIDEFQDTDPVQYRIFKTIHDSGHLPVFFIGDPKQAIYSFRGADIFAYLDAVEDAGDNIYTMKTNWRSDPSLVAAVNSLFATGDNPFHLEEISYQEISAAENRKDELTIESQKASGLDIISFSHETETNSGDAKISSTNADYRIARQLRSGISSLLEKDALLDGRKVEAGDIAVLVRTAWQARNAQQALRDANIPSVVSGGGNIFHTPEIHELHLWLGAITDPSNDGELRAALSTSLLDLNAARIDSLENDEHAWEQWIERFLDWNEHWSSSGFISLFRRLMEWKETEDCKAVHTRILSRPDGERRMTNLLHAAELIHAEATGRKLGPAQLMGWIESRMASAGSYNDAEELRLESDADAVQIVTIHSSKGLQYPIVFCPYTSYGPSLHQADRDFLVYHDKNEGNQLKLNISPQEEDPGLDMVWKELYAEDLRLLYVALTRARNRCTIFWGAFPRYHDSALAWLLGLESRTDSALRAAAVKLCEKSPESIRLLEEDTGYAPRRLPREGAGESLSCRVAERRLSRSWRTSSYSGLTSKNHYVHPHQPAGQDHDDGDSDDAAPDEHEAALAKPILLKGFGGGAVAGSCIHSIYEHLDFSDSDPAHLEELTGKYLDSYGLDSSSWLAAVCETIRETLKTPLDPAVSGLALEKIAKGQRLDEMQFLFPVSQDIEGRGLGGALDPARLAEIFSSVNSEMVPPVYPDMLAALDFQHLRGFLTGFIDLTFVHNGKWYIVDYKSNHLGARMGDYQEENISATMMSHHYILQYHIYTVALHRYLRSRLPDYDYEEHFGGVYYLFIKGMKENLGPGNGIFRDRPPRALTESLSSIFEGVKA
jgi:exodeoxyribonuclease V beta subunit